MQNVTIYDAAAFHTSVSAIIFILIYMVLILLIINILKSNIACIANSLYHEYVLLQLQFSNEFQLSIIIEKTGQQQKNL